MDQIAPKTGFDLESARTGANKEAAADAPRPAFPPTEIPSDVNKAMITAPEAGLRYIAEGATTKDPHKQFSDSQAAIEKAMSAMFEREGVDPNNGDPEVISNLATEEAMQEDLYVEFNQLMAAQESITEDANKLIQLKREKLLQLAISGLFTAGGAAATIVNGPGIGTFFVAASVLRLAQTYSGFKDEREFNKVINNHKPQVKEVTKTAEKEIRRILNEAKKAPEGMSQERLEAIFNIINFQAVEISKIKGLLVEQKNPNDQTNSQSSVN